MLLVNVILPNKNVVSNAQPVLSKPVKVVVFSIKNSPVSEDLYYNVSCKVFEATCEFFFLLAISPNAWLGDFNSRITACVGKLQPFTVHLIIL